MSPDHVPTDGIAEIACTVRNSGSWAGAEVVQALPQRPGGVGDAAAALAGGFRPGSSSPGRHAGCGSGCTPTKMMGVFAEFEHAMIQERGASGLLGPGAKASGSGGHPNPAELEEAIKALNKPGRTEGVRQIAARVRR